MYYLPSSQQTHHTYSAELLSCLNTSSHQSPDSRNHNSLDSYWWTSTATLNEMISDWAFTDQSYPIIMVKLVDEWLTQSWCYCPHPPMARNRICSPLTKSCAKWSICLNHCHMVAFSLHWSHLHQLLEWREGPVTVVTDVDATLTSVDHQSSGRLGCHPRSWSEE